MKQRYRFRTSQGYVYLSLDLASLKERTWETRDNYGNLDGGTASATDTTDFVVDYGEEVLDKLFKCCGIYSVEKMADGSLWAIIELEDGYYGGPEYMLELYEQ